MTVELFCLGFFAIVIIISILLQQLSSMFNFSLKQILGSRENIQFSGLTGRLERSILNSVIAMALFAPSIIILALVNITTPQTVIAAQIFIIARLIYSISYGLNISFLRSAGWIVGLLCTLFLYYHVFYQNVWYLWKSVGIAKKTKFYPIC